MNDANNEIHNFALVRRPASAVEKAAPGARRILSCMVADSLALVRKTRPRIVVVDDEPMILKCCEGMILQCFKDATVLSFDNGDQAWQELLRTKPDLLITDMNRPGLNGWKMLPLLATKEIKFPILVASGGAAEKDVRQCAGYDLNVSFLTKPFSTAVFHQELLKHLAGKVVNVLALFPAGDTIAQFNLGICYQNGFGVPQDYGEAVKWYRKAAVQDHAVAQNELGMFYDSGEGVEKDYAEAVKWYRKAAEQNLAVAQNNLGVCYYDGEGVEKNYPEAVKWYRKAAEQNHADGQKNLGLCYALGQGVEKNYAEAVKWYRQAAEQNDAVAQNELGLCYYSGEGVGKDYAEAVKWYRKAAEQNQAVAQYNLGDCYYNGEGVEKDYAEAVKWYRKAAEQNQANGQFSLGFCYEQDQGVPQDFIEAYKFYKLAAEQKQDNAVENLKEIATRMTAVEIREGERHYREFRPQESF